MKDGQPNIGSNKKFLWIILGIVIVLLLVVFLGGSRGGSFNFGSPYFPGPGATVEQNNDGSATYTAEYEGTTAVVDVNGNTMPENWPEDAPPAYTGATITTSSGIAQTGDATASTVTYTTTASLESVVEYYTSHLKAEKWTIENSTNVQGNAAIAASKDTRRFSAFIGRVQNVTQVVAGVEVKQ